MPIAENLSKGFTPPTVQPVQQAVTVTQTPNGNVPANSVQPISSTNLAVPSIFGSVAPLPTSADIPEPQAQATSFVASVNDRNLPTLSRQGMAKGDFYLSLNGAVYKCDPLKYFLLQCAAYRTSMNQDGDITFATKNMQYMNSQQGEHYHCLVLVFHQDRLVPAKAEFRTTKSSAATKMIAEIEACNSSEWIQKSDAHRIAAQCTVPWGRVIGSSVPGLAKNGPNGPYIPAITSTRPATLEEMQLLFNEGNKQDFQELFATVKGEWEERKAVLDSKCK